MNPDDLAILERLLDSYDLSRVLAALRDICHEKSAHLAANWQDHNAARAWDLAARTCDRVSESRPVAMVSA